MLQDFQQMQVMSQDGYIPPEINYSEYDIVHDFKNVFGNINPDSLSYLYRELESTIQLEEINKHRKLIQQSTFDYVILPIQELGQPGQDVVSRLLSAELLAEKLADCTGRNVLSPEMVLRAFGWKKTIYDENVLFNLISQQNSKIVHLYLKKVMTMPLSTPNKEKYDLAVVISDHRGVITKQNIYRIDGVTPLITLEEKVRIISDDIIGQITGMPFVPARNPQKLAAATSRVSTKSIEFLAQLASPCDQSAYFQLLALLTPPSFQSDRAHLFIRSLLALEKAPENSPNVLLLKARALHYLHRRPQAMKLLADPHGPAMKALRAYLNGNYFATKKAVNQIDTPLLYALSHLELFGLSLEYGKKEPELDFTKVKGPWTWMIQRRCKAYDDWHNDRFIELWGTMKKIAPEMNDFEKQISDTLTLTDMNDEDPEIVIIEQLVGLLREAPLTGDVYSSQLTSSDINKFYQNLLVDNLESRLHKIINLQGRYAEGVEFAERRAAVLDGHPRFTYLYGEGLLNLAEMNHDN